VHDETLRAEFTHQAEGFNSSAVAHAAETLDALVATLTAGHYGCGRPRTEATFRIVWCRHRREI